MSLSRFIFRAPSRARPIHAAALAAALLFAHPAGAQEAPVNSVSDLQYDLQAVREGAAVPYLVAGQVPDDLKYADDRKEAFFKTILPLILSVNDDIMITRRHLLNLNRIAARGGHLTPEQLDWLRRLNEYYKTPLDGGGVINLARLIPRVDVIPPSLAMSQGAEESGFGSSRFADQGNALFGELTKEAGGIPTNAPSLKGTGLSVRAFETLRASISAYARNLNSHAAYEDFRVARATMRLAKQPLDSLVLATKLEDYCGCGKGYISRLQNLMDINHLQDFDAARLALAH